MAEVGRSLRRDAGERTNQPTKQTKKQNKKRHRTDGIPPSRELSSMTRAGSAREQARLERREPGDPGREEGIEGGG